MAKWETEVVSKSSSIFLQQLTQSIVAICLAVLALLGESCKPKEEVLAKDGVFLTFSDDTVVFDTLFSTVGSVTRRLVVRNPSSNAVRLERIALGGLGSSSYQMVVDGVQGPLVQGIEILGKDSILILLSVLIDPRNQNLPFVVTDSILFENNGVSQHIQLAAWGQDALFLNSSVIGCDTTWTSSRPIVVYNAALVPFGCTLTMLPGTRVYMHNGANFFVQGRLNIQGSAEEKVQFRGTRLEARFEQTPGQWGSIILLDSASSSSEINHAVIRNGTNGIRFGKPDDGDSVPDLLIANTLIRNMSATGLLFISTDVDVVNTVVANCGSSTVSLLAGGQYRFLHCSVADFSTLFRREEESILVSNNLVLGDNSVLRAPLSFTCINTILYGNLREELLLSNDPAVSFALDIRHSILRTERTAFAVNNNKLNVSPRFKNVAQVDYQLDTLSPARNAGITIVGFPATASDFLGVSRPQGDTVDIGAFERKE
jgi:hypothetical protein